MNFLFSNYGAFVLSYIFFWKMFHKAADFKLKYQNVSFRNNIWFYNNSE